MWSCGRGPAARDDVSCGGEEEEGDEERKKRASERTSRLKVGENQSVFARGREGGREADGERSNQREGGHANSEFDLDEKLA